MQLQKQDLLYKGKAKSVYETENPDYLIPVSYTHLTLPTRAIV